jgi:hypothetical protein
MSAIPFSARFTIIALRLESMLEVAFWLALSVLFLFVLGIPDTWAVANYTSWAVFRVLSGAVHPFLSKCDAGIRYKAWGIVGRELRILRETRAIVRRGANPRILTEIQNALRR